MLCGHEGRTIGHLGGSHLVVPHQLVGHLRLGCQQHCLLVVHVQDRLAAWQGRGGEALADPD